jgi:hypothetical protein
MDIFELVMRVKKQQGSKYSLPQAIQYIATLTGKTFGFSSTLNDSNGEKIDDWNWINRHKKKDKIETTLSEYDSTVMDLFLPYPHEKWLNEDISYETQRKFNIGYYIKDERIVIPHYDINSRLVGIRGRSMKDEDIEAGKKYMPLTIGNQLYNHQTMFNLYGLHKTKEAIKRLKKVAIFEGEKSVLKCEGFYGEDNFTVAVCSSNITNFHKDILLSLDIEEVIICFDRFRDKKENESEEKFQEQIDDYQKKLLKFARKFTPYVRTYIVYDDFELLQAKESPVDKGKDILEQLMKCKYEIKTVNEVEI